MIRLGEKIKISGFEVTIVKIFDGNEMKVIYRDKGNDKRVSNFIVLNEGVWKFENDYGRVLKDSEYSDYEI